MSRVSLMSDHRAVFLLPEKGDVAVFLASRGKSPRIAHERAFTDRGAAASYARILADRFGCPVVGACADRSSGEDVA